MPNQKDVIDSHKLIIDVFKEFRAELMQHFGNVNHTVKSDLSPVTALDIKIEETLKEKLLKQFPDFGFKGEETDEVISKNNSTWYIDPIDGTSSFIHGLPYCSNMAGLVVNGEIVASIIYHFTTDELFTAIKGQGAYKNAKQIYVNNTKLSDSYVFADAYSYLNIYRFYGPSKVKFYAPMGATGYFLTRVAQGSIQGACYLKAKINNHDVIPGALLVLEAGGDAVSFEDESFYYKSLKFIIGTKNICNLTNEHLAEILARR